MRDLEKLWVSCCETQSEPEIFLLFIMGQTKPTHNGDALTSLERDTLTGTVLRDQYRAKARLPAKHDPLSMGTSSPRAT